MALGIILISVLILAVLIVVYYFNRFVILENRIDNSHSQIDDQLKKRNDLVPNLLNTIKGYMKHERSAITEVTNARKALVGAGNLSARAKAGADLQSALKSVFAIAENYPNLKANENFMQLQQELSAIEERIAYARQFYNDSILTFNNTVEAFPGVMFANLFGKKEREMLQITKEERALPKKSF